MGVHWWCFGRPWKFLADSFGVSEGWPETQQQKKEQSKRKRDTPTRTQHLLRNRASRSMTHRFRFGVVFGRFSLVFTAVSQGRGTFVAEGFLGAFFASSWCLLGSPFGAMLVRSLVGGSWVALLSSWASLGGPLVSRGLARSPAV